MRKRLWLIGLLFFAVISAQAQNDTVLFSAKGGFYDNVFALQLSNANPQNHIRYVLFVIDKYAGATNLIDELDIRKSEPQPIREETEN